jgi:hypothetical protein
MDTPSKTIEKPILLNLADRLMEAQREVDELTVQLALGKAEATEKYEEIKKEFNDRLVQLKKDILSRGLQSPFDELIKGIEKLEDRLTIGRAESKEMFVAQRKFIMRALNNLEKEVKRILPGSLDTQHLSHEMESFKLKLEILRLRFVLKRFEVKDEIKSNAQEIQRRVARLIEKARMKISQGGKKVIQLNKDISGVFR